MLNNEAQAATTTQLLNPNARTISFNPCANFNRTKSRCVTR
jgi:hypothetical protein